MIPKILISSPASSSGKTTIVCAISQLLLKNALSILKVGPDYIDPLFHSQIFGAKTGNLDLFFNSPNELLKIFENHTKNSDFAIIEGAMGYFDGVGGNTFQASAFDVAKNLDSPVILVVDVKGKSLSICAEILGFLETEKLFSNKNYIKGVILNRCSSSLYEIISPKIKEICKIETFGYLENNADFSIESRHLGLVTPDSVCNLKEKIEKLSESAKKTIDLERILKLAESSDDIKKEQHQNFTSKTKKVVKIAIARDEAFCFYYRENLELLESFGAELCFFSPLKNEIIPKNCSALYIGGGYPELFWEKLTKNSLTSYSVRQFARKGGLVFAECGGFMYLQMLGLLKGSFENKKKLVRFGYIELEANEDNFLLKKGEKIRGHEFHYFDTTENGNSFTATKPNGKSWNCINVSSSLSEFEKTCHSSVKAFEKNIIAGFPHFYFPSNPKIAENFVESALFFESMKSVSKNTCDGGCSNCESCGKCNLEKQNGQ